MPRSLRWLAVTGLATALAGCGGGHGVADAGPDVPAPAVSPSSSGGVELPTGWRWESFQDVEVAVPGGWGYTGSSRISQWCAQGNGTSLPPAVGRPGPSTGVLCPEPKKGGVDPGSLLRNGGTYVAFAGVGAELRTEGDRTVLRRSGVAVVIQAPAKVRKRIAATVHTIEGTDSNGCPVDHPLGSDKTWEPPGRPVEEVTDVESVSACKYALAVASDPIDGHTGSGPDLLSSVRLDGAAAQRSIDGIAAAPIGGGPNSPETCSKDYSYGDDAIVVLAHRSNGKTVPIVLRYASCDHNGFSDGVSVRTLTAKSVGPFIAGSNRVSSYSGGSEKTAVLNPDQYENALEKERGGR